MLGGPSAPARPPPCACLLQERPRDTRVGSPDPRGAGHGGRSLWPQGLLEDRELRPEASVPGVRSAIARSFTEESPRASEAAPGPPLCSRPRPAALRHRAPPTVGGAGARERRLRASPRLLALALLPPAPAPEAQGLMSSQRGPASQRGRRRRHGRSCAREPRPPRGGPGGNP